MQLIDFSIYSYLAFAITIFTTLVFLYLFYRAIKSQTSKRLLLLTKAVLLLSILISLIKYWFDETAVLPLRSEDDPLGFHSSLVYLAVYVILLVFAFTSISKKFAIATWVIILVFNCFTFCSVTYHYLTWSPQLPGNPASSSEIIFSHVTDYTFARYLFNIGSSTTWIVLSSIALNKFRKTTKVVAQPL